MKNFTYVISRDDYEKAQKDGAESIIGDSIKQQYGVNNAKVIKTDDAYLLTYERRRDG